MKSAEHTDAGDFSGGEKRMETSTLLLHASNHSDFLGSTAAWLRFWNRKPNFTRTFPCQAKGRVRLLADKIMLLIQKLEEECVRLPRNWN